MSFDVTEAVAALASITAAVALVGGAKTIPTAAITGWRYVKAAIKG